MGENNNWNQNWPLIAFLVLLVAGLGFSNPSHDYKPARKDSSNNQASIANQWQPLDSYQNSSEQPGSYAKPVSQEKREKYCWNKGNQLRIDGKIDFYRDVTKANPSNSVCEFLVSSADEQCRSLYKVDLDSFEGMEHASKAARAGDICHRAYEMMKYEDAVRVEGAQVQGSDYYVLSSLGAYSR